MRNFTFIKNVKGSLSIKLSSYDMMLPEKIFTIAYNVDKISIPEQYALGLFVSSGALHQYQSGFFKVENMEDLEKAASMIGLFVEPMESQAKDQKEIVEMLKNNDVASLEKVIENGNAVDMKNLIVIARQEFDSLSKSVIEKIEKACGVELEIE